MAAKSVEFKLFAKITIFATYSSKYTPNQPNSIHRVFVLQNEDGKTYLSDNVVKTNCNQEIWILLGTFIDRITFLIYVLLFIALYNRN